MRGPNNRQSISKQSIQRGISRQNSGRSLKSTASNLRPQGNMLFEFETEPRLSLRTEIKYDWSKEGIINLFNEFSTLQTYKTVVEEPNIKLSISEKGHRFQKFHAVYRTEYVFNAKFKMEEIINALHNTKCRLEWDEYIDTHNTVKKLGRVALIHETFKPVAFEGVQRDMFVKKFGFTHRPMQGQASVDQSFNSNHQQSSCNNSFLTERRQVSRDLLDYYFFYSSVDNKDLTAAECPVKNKDVSRTQVYLGMHKFEKIRRLREDHQLFNEDQKGLSQAALNNQLDDINFQECVKVTILFQADSKINKWKQGLVRAALPGVTTDFYNNLTKYMEKTQKKNNN